MARRKRGTARVYRTYPVDSFSSEMAVEAVQAQALAYPWVSTVSEARVLLSPDSKRWQVSTAIQVNAGYRETTTDSKESVPDGSPTPRRRGRRRVDTVKREL
jgi:hypothetical protein